ncbi:MAG: OPT/YSL family transporter [Archangium sp.]|nr:OPT/YSL family transporter [Archangium sp.]MDP3151176.1 OPT/YSL family transporter [Archangium sp.]MDP3570183.1 OPT/YSL family transporter [Archangium sp.]
MTTAAKKPLLQRLIPIGTPGYHVFLASIAILILGPLGGVTAAYMNYALGFFVGGQVLAGILGSTVTYFYGPEGKHGANYMQTMAASVSSMAAMGVLIQAMVWLGMPLPPTWLLITYFLCIGMFGVGVGMLYTPILVDKLQLTYPSGLAVANILRALTDVRLLRRSVGTLGGGIFSGIVLSVIVSKVNAWVETLKDKPGTLMTWAASFSAVTFGGGMIVGARIAVSAILVGGIGLLMSPWLVRNGYLGPDDPFRKIGFIFALGTILGAAIVDLSLLARDAMKKVRAAKAEAVPTTGPKANVGRLLLWVAFWAVALAIVATQMLNVPVGWVVLAIVLAFVFQMINGISQGITDQNPISSAFVVTVLLMGLLGLRDPLIGLLGGSILLVSCTVGVDMQQDRSTGWRLGSDRSVQFRYQMLGIVFGAVVAVVMTRVFLEGFPVLNKNLFDMPELRHTEARGWQSAMTYKFVGVLNTLNKDQSKTLGVMGLGVIAGFVIEVLRKVIFKNPKYLAWKKKSAANNAVDFTLDALILASPYASSFGGFVDFESSIWWGIGGIVATLLASRRAPAPVAKDGEILPEDMSATSLVGGGLIAGESLFALWLGISGLVSRGALGKIFGG